MIAAELIAQAKKSGTINWSLRASARAKIKVRVKPQPRQLPAGSTGKAMKTALAQAELLRASGREANF